MYSFGETAKTLPVCLAECANLVEVNCGTKYSAPVSIR